MRQQMFDDGDNRTAALAASAWADGWEAPRDSVTRAVAGLAGRRPGLVLVFPDAALPPQDVLAQAAAAAPGCPLAGMTSAGLISSDGVRFRGCSAIAFSDAVSARVGMSHDASRDRHAAGRGAAEVAMRGLDPRPGHAVLLLFVDPTSGDEAASIDGAYSIVGGAVPMAGGGANGVVPVLFAGDSAGSDAVVAVGLTSSAPISVGIAHGCHPRADPAIATRTEGRALRELNGLPAEDVYLDGLGQPDARLDDDDFEALAVLHPLGQPELRGQLRLRHVIGRAPGGGLECATPIPPNAAVWFTEQTPQTIVDSAARVVEETVALLDCPPRAGLIFDCAARKRALGTGLDEEARALLSAFGEQPAVTGLYTRGEVGRTRGAKGDRNHAVVVVAFG